MNFTEIGKRIKSKTRDYDDLSDYETGKAYAYKYLKDDLHLIDDDNALILFDGKTDVEIDQQLQNQLQKHVDNINSDPNWFLGVRDWRLQRKTEYIIKRTANITSFIQAKQQLEQLQRNYKIQQALEVKNFHAQIELATTLIAKERCTRQLVTAATELGMLPEDLSEVQKQKLLVDIDVLKHRRLKEVDDEMEEKSKQRALRYALAYQNLNLASAQEVLFELQRLKKLRFDLQNSGQPIQLIQDQIKDFNRHIAALEEAHGRLLQGPTQENLRGGNSDTDSRGISSPDLAEGTE
jgi:hypothetical protein